MSTRDENQNILKRKIAASGRDPGPVHLIADLPSRMGAEAAAAFTEYFGEKSQLAETEAAFFSRLDEALAPYASKAGIYHFRFNGDEDFVLVLDVDTSMRAAGWSLSGARDIPEPKPEAVSAIDRRLAKRLAIRSAEVMFENAEKCGLAKGGIELIASGSDPRRFDFIDEARRVVCATFSVKTLDDERLGTIRVFASEKILLAMREYYGTTMVLAEQKWVQDLKKLAAMSPVMMRADLAGEDITLGALMALKPGQVINLSAATIDEVTVTPSLPTQSKLSMAGALGNRDGARALRIKSITY